MKKLVVLLFVAMMAVPALVAQGAGSTPVPTCLTVTGTAAASPTTVDVEEPIALTYTLTPGGSYTQVVTRSAANLVMVLDESGSMNFTDDSGRNPPTRMSILKTSAKSLIDQLKTVNLHDKAGLVKFDTTASKLQDLIDATTTSGANTLKTKIDSLNPDGGTNIEHGLRLANNMLTGMGNPYVILVTDGYATHYTNSSGGGVESTSKAKSLALTAADQLAAAKVPVYTVALGKAGSSDVDHTLLTNIAAKTGGKKYDASNTTELTQVFTKIQQEIAKQSTIKTIAIRQPLPAGFTLADDAYQGAYIEEATNTLVIPVDDISYPYTIANTIVKVNIMKTGEGGTFKLGNAELSYKNACGSIASTSIALNANVTVYDKISVTDKYGNLYEGNRFGDVTRYRDGDREEPQWKVPGPYSGYRVTSIALTDADHTQLRVNWRNGSNRTKSEDWDLTPTTPPLSKYVLRDVGGDSITSETSWKRGPATIQLSGSTFTTLPENGSVNLLNDDFGSKYAFYQFRIASIPQYKDWTTIDANTKIDASGTLKVEVRAGTEAISGNQDTVFFSDTLSKTIKLDSAPPEKPVVSAKFTPTYKVQELKVTNVTDKGVGVKTAGVYRDGVLFKALPTDNDPNKSTTFTANKETDKLTIVVTDKFDLERNEPFDGWRSDDSGPVVTHSIDKVADPTDRQITVTVSEPESYLPALPADKKPTLMIDKSILVNPSTDLPNKAVYTFKLSDYFQDKQLRAAANHTFSVWAVNVDGRQGNDDSFDLTIDNVKPEMPLATSTFTSTYHQYEYTVSNIKDDDNGVGIATADLYRDGVLVKSLLNDRTFTASKDEIDTGLISVKVTDLAGNWTVKKDWQPPSDRTIPHITYAKKESVDPTNPMITVKVHDDESPIHNSSVVLDGIGIDSTNASIETMDDGKTIVYTFHLDHIIANADARAAWHQIIVHATNFDDQETAKQYFLKVYPDISAQLRPAGEGDFSVASTDKPVLMKLDFNEELVREATFTDLDSGQSIHFDAVKIVKLMYAVSPKQEITDAIPFYKLGADQFLVSKEGDNWVYVQLVDNDKEYDESTGSIGASAPNTFTVGPVHVKIDYNQNQY